MPLIHNDPEHWRKRAEEARKLANEMTDPVGQEGNARDRREIRSRR
jgi:hypothetical protein